MVCTFQNRTVMNGLNQLSGSGTLMKSDGNNAEISTDARISSGSSQMEEEEKKVEQEYIQPNELKIVGEIGRGAFGNVEKVIHIPTQRIFALKVCLSYC